MRFVPGPGQAPWSPAGTWRVLPTPTELAAPANPRALSTRRTRALRKGTRAVLGQAPVPTRWLGGVSPGREGTGSTDRWHDRPHVQLLGFVRLGRAGDLERTSADDQEEPRKSVSSRWKKW